MEYLLIDGYNIINSWRDVFNPAKEPLEDCRDRLLHIISNYQGYSNKKIIIVFDAYNMEYEKNTIESFDNITVIYTKKNQTADNYIERFVYDMGNTHLVSVVTSDYLEQTIVLNKGGIRITPKEFKSLVYKKDGSVKARHSGKNTGNTISSNIDPELVKELEKLRRSDY